ncbi:hypothetical protein WJX73_002188 [Symbiochloris irregularis]|uniref:Aminomethyltransferase n=1 Tax=Symbiochloris irregularis TaxID=706552 RepID=A0AAW1NRV2_9CHLO
MQALVGRQLSREGKQLFGAIVQRLRGQPGTALEPALYPALSRGYADESSLLKTPLYDYHVEQGGKMVPFAGWSMPVQYKDSLMDSVRHCRKDASIFDVSHMLGVTFKGKESVQFLEKLTVGDLQGIENGSGSLTLFTNDRGGIIDDTVLTKVGDNEIYLVVNAGCREKDIKHLSTHLKWFKDEGGDVDMIIHDDRSLLALQGPAAAEVLAPLVPALDLGKFYFSNFAKVDVDGKPCFVTRTGYTGEDGFEISVPDADATSLAKKLMENSRVKMSGLGARDALRLEAGLCLYGNDMTEDITPVQAGLKWTIGQRRRDACDFLGGEVIKKQLTDGVDERRVGLLAKGAPPRQHAEILTMEGEKVGEVTSGAFSPNINKNIAMGYVKKGHNKSGTKLQVAVRGRKSDAEVAKMPFVKTTYFRPS